MSPAVQATPRHAVLAGAAYVAVMLATMAWGALSLTGNEDLRGEIQRKSQFLAQLARRAATQAPRPMGAESAGPREAAISAPSETIAASELQKRILERLEGAGGFVQSVQAEPVKDAAGDGLRRLTAQLSFDTSTTGLQRLLFDLETGAPFMFVDVLAVQPATSSVPGTRVGDKLRVNLSVTSYWLANSESEKARAP
ncbi:MAG TPA: type II secretion system protein GspM [Hyphomicrobiaceae bacterium]|nr:type II secretion system protein GspM [Hyphomicrobiaceae bacterium]